MAIKLIPIIPKGRLPGRSAIIAKLKNAVRDTVAEGQRRLAEYPTKPAGSRYKRTNTLKRSWSNSVNMSGSKLEGRVRSNGGMAPYNVDVQGLLQEPLFQALGWRSVQTEAKVMEKELITRTRRAMSDLVG